MAFKMKDIKELDSKIKNLSKKTRKVESESSSSSSLGIAMKLSSEMVAAVFVASLIGYYLDKWLETEPFFLIILFFLGAITGILNVVRTSKMINKE
ncbi:AtpZ/AtpI family protein [bacterium]|jgi:ATP synthase protein I|nr:AtpZ/AtpI family protein [bacterium]MDC0425862.1 AtpZ/AtpI family protein [Pelagibacteraceae bacterium]